MNCDYVLQYLEKTEVPIVSKKNHDIIMCGLEKMIFLKEGVPVFRGLHHECLEAILRKS